MESKRIYKIYKLLHPLTKEIRYIGVTTNYLSSRLSQHWHTAIKKESYTHVGKWIRDLYKSGLKPSIQLIEECTENTWEEREKYWINKLPNLTNISKGGKGVIIDRSIESKQRSINGHKTKIVQLSKDYTLIKRWESLTEATESIGAKHKTSISNCLNKRSKTCKGFIWMFEEEYNKNSFTKVQIREQKTKIYQYDLNGSFIKEWESVSLATESNNIKYSSSVFDAAKKHSRSGNSYWSFEKLDSMKKFLKEKLIIRKSDGKVFNSFYEIRTEYKKKYCVSSQFYDKLRSQGFIFWENSFWEIQICKDIV